MKHIKEINEVLGTNYELWITPWYKTSVFYAILIILSIILIPLLLYLIYNLYIKYQSIETRTIKSLKKLLKLTQKNSIEVKLAYGKLTDILKNYTQKKYGLNAPGITDIEMLKFLKNINDLIYRCQEIKFSLKYFTLDNIKKDIETSLSLIYKKNI